MTKIFFKKQTALTAAKTRIYEEYIKGYLPKLLMTFEKVYIADLFCGPGKNGDKNGSPLILIESLNYILSSEQLKTKNSLRVFILFNDEDSASIANLNIELGKATYDRNIISIKVENKKYEELVPSVFQKLEKMTLPKFFFLDPFTYSNVKIEDLKKLISLSNAEVLLFIPIFHTYRFSNAKFEESHLTRIFIEQYTEAGITDYLNIHYFMASVRKKLLKTIGAPYVRSVLLDGGGSKNSLFLLTKHIKGMLLMNKIAFKMTEDGNCYQTKNEGIGSLFDSSETTLNFANYSLLLKEFLLQKDRTNKEIVEFTITNCFLPKHAKNELKRFSDNNKVKVYDENNFEITNISKWNIAENITNITIFKWVK
jgi:three-Cys-motif partner protein